MLAFLIPLSPFYEDNPTVERFASGRGQAGGGQLNVRKREIRALVWEVVD